MEVVLCADIGGTNTRLCLYQVDTSGNFAGLKLDKCEK
jgi:hexokinase